jgi:hypothetical protein
MTKGTLVAGDPGTGKTMYVAEQVASMAEQHPESGLLVQDASGALKKALILKILSLPPERGVKLLRRLVVDVLCHPDYIKPMPEFHPDYGVPLEDQVNRVSKNLIDMNPDVVERAILGGFSLDEIAKELFRLISITLNEHGENFQITEAKRLLMETDWLRSVVNAYGGRLPSVKAYIERMLLPSKGGLSQREIEMRTYSLKNVLGVLDTREARATLGYFRPAYTMKEVDEKGLIVVVSGEKLQNQDRLLGYLMTQRYSLFVQYINRREPDHPNNKRLMLVIDELPWLLKYPGMSQNVANIASWYRSRNVTLAIIIQSLSQLDDDLLARAWTFGNLVFFAMGNWDEAIEVSKQLFQYNPVSVKQDARTLLQNPITEPDRGQYDLGAYWVQHLKWRECVVKRFKDERRRDNYIRHVRQRKDIGSLPSQERYYEVYDELIKDRSVLVRDALEVVNQRRPKVLGGATGGQPPISV